ncbi:hypothetical protein V7112_05290 [Bacillus sp. JJ1566]|uniref:hypothetical protein n=1 Tax=Bacillus sp. JJ1566 TaxID=3122961 RepID=UPI002FFEF58C
MFWIIIGGIYAAVINYFGAKAAWISFGIGLFLGLISFGGLAGIATFLSIPVILRLIFVQVLPFLHVWWNDVKSK